MRGSRIPATLFVLLAIALFLLIGSHSQAMFLVFLSLILTWLYFRKSVFSGQPLKTKPLFKPLIIGVVFTIICFLVPVTVTADVPLTTLLTLAIPRICFIAALALISDREDKRSRENQDFKRYFIIASALLVCSSLADLAHFYTSTIHLQSLGMYLTTNIFTWIILVQTRQERGSFFYALFVDGMLAVPGIISLLYQVT